MKFGERILSSQHPPWSANYINYLRLKRLLTPLFGLEVPSSAEENGNGSIAITPSRGDGSSALNANRRFSPLHYNDLFSTNSTTSIATLEEDVTRVTSSSEFQRELNYEIQKALLFLLKSMGELASDLSALSEQRRFVAANVRALLLGRQDMGDDDRVHAYELLTPEQRHDVIRKQLGEIEALRMEYLVRIGNKLLLLLEFVELNIEAIVKIVKKHDKFLSKWEESSSSSSSSFHKRNNHHQNAKDDKSRYTRLRRQYLPRFAIFSSDPNVRCLFLAAADAGDCKSYKLTGNAIPLSSQSKPSDGNFGGWDVLQWNLEVALRELHTWQIDLHKALVASSSSSGNEGSIDADSGKNEASLHTFSPLSSRSYSEIPRATSTTHPSSDTNNTGGVGDDQASSSPIKKILSSSSTLFQLAATSISPTKAASESEASSFFEPMMYQIQSSRRRLGQMHHRYIRMVYAHEMLHLIDDDKHLEDERYLLQRKAEFGSVEKLERIRKESIGGDTIEEGGEQQQLLEQQWLTGGSSFPMVSKLSKFLNLTSAGLYMCNYNIVAPTSALYAKLLGFDEANAGIIIGMTPAAVIVSSVLYSWWSSYSYKRALMFASCCCMVGNIVYALALPCDSLAMVLLGRLLTGFGSARVINRRYIADYYSIEERTSGMADFVSASAFGMAMGPGLAAALGIIAPTELSDSNSFWTIETAPGYVMFVAWSIYLVCNFLFFEEPERIGHSSTATKNASSSPTGTKQPNNAGGSQQDTTTYAPSENSPLLDTSKKVDGTSSPDDTKGCLQRVQSMLRSCYNIPVLISIVLLMLLKSVLEGLSSSAPTVSRYYFGWGVHASGIYLAALASFVLPTNFVVAYVSRRLDDRELILGALVMMFVGILGFLVYSEDGDEYSEIQFILFGLIIFVSCNALEGPVMGLLSKTIPKSLARGIFNAGLLATEAGTLGRVVGDFWLSSATFMGLSQMLNRTFEPMCAMVGVSIFASIWSYPHLQPRFDDEDDD